MRKPPRRPCERNANAGTHNYRRMLFEQAGATTHRNDVSLWLWVPAFALGHAHISEAPADRDGMEVFETVFEGDWARRLGRRVAVPATQAADDPGGPGEAVRLIRVLQSFCPGLELSIEDGQGGNLVGGEDQMDRLLAAVPCLQELDGDDGGLGGDGNQFEEPVGGTDFTVFELEALRLKDAEELLNDPALLVPFDNAP